MFFPNAAKNHKTRFISSEFILDNHGALNIVTIPLTSTLVTNPQQISLG